MTRVKFDLDKFRADLTELAGKTHFTLRTNRTLPVRISVKELDNKFAILVNPARVRTDADYSFVLKSVTDSLNWHQ